MTDTGAAKSGLMNIGQEAKPPFVILPDPASLYLARSRRFADLAAGHKLSTYLSFLSRVTQAQHEIVLQLPSVSMPAAEAIAQASVHGMPPLAFDNLVADAAAETVRNLMTRLSGVEMPAEAAAAAQALRTASGEQLTSLMSEAFDIGASTADLPLRIFVFAGLQVHASRLAANLDSDSLQPIADGVCPACGSAPAASVVVGWPNAHNSRFCICSLCSTYWNVVRIKCALCSETGGISYHTIDGQPDAVKAESCNKGRHYLKIGYQVNDHRLEPFADDVATVGLDMLMREEGWIRGGRNPFLLGY